MRLCQYEVRPYAGVVHRCSGRRSLLPSASVKTSLVLSSARHLSSLNSFLTHIPSVLRSQKMHNLPINPLIVASLQQCFQCCQNSSQPVCGAVDAQGLPLYYSYTGNVTTPNGAAARRRLWQGGERVIFCERSFRLRGHFASLRAYRNVPAHPIRPHPVCLPACPPGYVACLSSCQDLHESIDDLEASSTASVYPLAYLSFQQTCSALTG